MEDLGYSPQQIDRMAGSREADALLNALTNPGGFGAGEPAQPAANGAVPPEAAPVPPQG
jgi:hypothetical protein